MGLKKQKSGLDYLNRDKHKWRPVMNKVMNFQLPRNVGNILSETVLACPEELCSRNTGC
jgi:hypothetical protein